jgi:Mg2+/Co2+ transporter CorB
MISFFWVLLVFLVVLSAFFSSAETGIMSFNRYRLRYLVGQGNAKAKRIEGMLERPDRVLGTILLGNTFSNILASAVATVLAQHYFGDFGIIVGSVMLTIVVLIFAETAPKTYAAFYPEKIALSYSSLITILLKAFYPLVWLVNLVANGVLNLCRVKLDQVRESALSVDEFKAMVLQVTGRVRQRYQAMLLRVLELDKVAVEHVMVPKSDVYGVDLSDDWHRIKTRLLECPYNNVPLYRNHIDNVEKILNVKSALALLCQEAQLSSLLDVAEPVSYVPAEAEVSHQLFLFQKNKQKMGAVADEHGNLLGVVTLRDMLDEILGEFVSDLTGVSDLFQTCKDGSVIVSGKMNLLDLDRCLGSQFSTANATTLSGLIIEYLEVIPSCLLGFWLGGYPMEILKLNQHTIASVKIYPELAR